MRMQGTRLIAADRAAVWAALNDPAALKASIPGCTAMERLSDTALEATVLAKVGPVKATFKGAVTLADIRAPESYTLIGEGKGGVAGFAKGEARVTLAEVADGTELSYDAEARVGGKLAQLGSRIVDGFARRMAEEFFTSFQRQLEGPEPEAAEATDSAEEAAPERGPDEALPSEGPKKGFFRRMFG